MAQTRNVMTVQTESQTAFATGLTGAGPFLTFSALTDGPLAHQVTLTSAANLSAITLTLTGVDADGKTITEAIVGPNIATVEGLKYFRSLSSIVASATLGANTMNVGIADEVVSAMLPLNWRQDVVSNIVIDVTGTINLDVEFTLADVNLFADASLVPWFIGSASLDDETADSASIVTIPSGVSAARVRVNSYSAGAAVATYIGQADNV